ncbi:hypothetical protein A5686_05085 [Mycobacterium sp. E2479]|nr:hypothetical protein A5686_05085 [Mycobacterium sp. E2479]
MLNTATDKGAREEFYRGQFVGRPVCLGRVVSGRCLGAAITYQILGGGREIHPAAADGLGLSGAMSVGCLSMCCRVSYPQASRLLVNFGGPVVRVGREE